MVGRRLEAQNFWPARLGDGKTIPQVCECEDGSFWVVKLPGSPGAQNWELCADWIGSTLAGLANVPTPQCALIHVGVLALQTLPAGPAQWAKAGTAYGSAYLASARPVTGSLAVERGMAPLDLMRVVATDTWLGVLDRKKPQRGQWNLLEDTGTLPPRILTIDYGMSLTDVLSYTLVPLPIAAQCPEEWRPRLREEDIARAAGDVNAVTEEQIRGVVDAIPEDWRASVARLDKVPAYLLQRQAELEACLRRDLQL